MNTKTFETYESQVRSYCRSFPAVFTKAVGSEMFDEDGNRYIDYVCSWGAMILGHNHGDIRSAMEKAMKNGVSFGADTELELELAEV